MSVHKSGEEAGLGAARQWSFAEFSVDLDLGELRSPDGLLKIEPKSLEVLATLCRRAGAVCAREELIETVWRDRFVTEEVLTHCIWELRKALGDSARQPRFIKTVPRRGYRFLLEPTVESSVESTAEPAEALDPLTPDAALGPAEAVAAPVGATGHSEPGGSVADAGAATEASIAVLPLSDFSAGGEAQYVADGLSEELIFELSRCRGFRTICRTSCLRYRNSEEDVTEIGRQLGVSFLIEGSVRKSTKRVRVTLRLIDVGAGSERWSGRFDREVTHLIEVQEEVAGRVAEEIAGQLQESDRSSARMSGEAFEAFLLGRYHFNQRTEPSLRSALAAFEHARTLAPESPRPLSSLANCHLLLGVYGSIAPAEVLARVEGFVTRAIELDAESAAAFATLGQLEALYKWRWREAEDAFNRAIELDPEDSSGRLWLALNCLVPQGRFEEARAQIDDAIRLDPLDVILLTSRGILEYYANLPELAESCFDRALEVVPGFGLAHQFRGLARLESGADGALSDLARAAGGELASDEAISAHAAGLARKGRANEARAALGNLLERAETRYVSPVLEAQVHAGLGDVGKSVEALARAFAVGSPELVWLTRRPTFAGVLEAAGDQLRLSRLGLPGA